MKTIQILLLLILISVLKVAAQQNRISSNLYFKFDTNDPKQRTSILPFSGEVAYYYEYPCLLGLSMDPSLKTLDKNVFTTVSISQLVQYDVMTIQDFCQRCAATGSEQAQSNWLKPYLYRHTGYKIFVVHINHTNQTAKIVEVKWTAWDE